MKRWADPQYAGAVSEPTMNTFLVPPPPGYQTRVPAGAVSEPTMNTFVLLGTRPGLRNAEPRPYTDSPWAQNTGVSN
eukprot:6960023-Pyramimonas_sp.AAC.1